MAVLIFLIVAWVIVIGTFSTASNPSTYNKPITKQKRYNNSINTYGKYKQVKRYYAYSRGRKLW